MAVVNGYHDLLADDPAAFSGDVWTSTDSGATWTDQTVSSPSHGQEWKSVASDSSGTNLVAVSVGAIWTSTDAGVTWTKRQRLRLAWPAGLESVASDATGTNLVAVGYGAGSGLRATVV